jgi:hypothetical protein
LVTRNVDTPGGDIFVMSATVESAMVRVLARPAQMNPRASAPAFIAKRASSADAMQQTLIRVLIPLESDKAVSSAMSAFHVRRDKAAFFQWVQVPPGNRSSRKQPEQAWRRRSV